MRDTVIKDLAAQQLDAYNRADLDAFCACYHNDVVVLDEDGDVISAGMDAFRARYTGLFAAGGFGATVAERIVMGRHCVDLEHYWRPGSHADSRQEGTVLVRYVEREGRIGVVQFFRP